MTSIRACRAGPVVPGFVSLFIGLSWMMPRVAYRLNWLSHYPRSLAAWLGPTKKRHVVLRYAVNQAKRYLALSMKIARQPAGSSLCPVKMA